MEIHKENNLSKTSIVGAAIFLIILGFVSGFISSSFHNKPKVLPEKENGSRSDAPETESKSVGTGISPAIIDPGVSFIDLTSQ